MAKTRKGREPTRKGRETTRKGRETTGAPGAGLSGEDLDLWRRATARDKRLEGHDPMEPPAPPEPPAPSEAGAPSRKPSPPPPPASAGALPEVGVGRSPGLDKRSAQRLKRGQLPVDDRIDLHGMTQAEAHGALDDFLASAQGAGHRCVLVITGKGVRPDGATGVLRAMVPRWLNEPPNRARVLAIDTAQPRHGGAGAFYVLLKKSR